jgi:hypothetical protein
MPCLTYLVSTAPSTRRPLHHSKPYCERSKKKVACEQATVTIFALIRQSEAGQPATAYCLPLTDLVDPDDDDRLGDCFCIEGVPADRLLLTDGVLFTVAGLDRS